MRTTSIAFALAAATLAGAAAAQPAGSFSARIGATHIAPDVSSGNLSAPSLPNTQVDVKHASQLSGGVTWMATPNWAVDVPLALPFRHDIVGAGAIAGAGKLGDVKALPITVFAQYRFGAADAKFRPYLGAGPTYAKFWGERGSGTLSGLTGGSPTRLSIKSRLGLTLQAGGMFMVNDRWFVDAMVAKTWLKTTTTLSTGQRIDTKLDPVSVSIGVGYRF